MKRTLVPAPYWLVHGLVQRQITQVHLPVDVDRLEADLDRLVRPDPGFFATGEGVQGRVRVQLNQHGAVSVLRPSLGLRPGEFHFVCPFVDGGETALRDRGSGTWHIEGGSGQIAFTETWAVAGYRSADGPEPSREELVAQAPREAVLYAGDYKHGPNVWTAPWARSRWFGRAHMPMEYVRLHAVIRGVKLRRFDTLTPADVAESQALSLDRTPKDDVAAFAHRWGNQHGRVTSAPRWVWTLHIASVNEPPRGP